MADFIKHINIDNQTRAALIVPAPEGSRISLQSKEFKGRQCNEIYFTNDKWNVDVISDKECFLDDDGLRSALQSDEAYIQKWLDGTI